MTQKKPQLSLLIGCRCVAVLRRRMQEAEQKQAQLSRKYTCFQSLMDASRPNKMASTSGSSGVRSASATPPPSSSSASTDADRPKKARLESPAASPTPVNVVSMATIAKMASSAAADASGEHASSASNSSAASKEDASSAKMKEYAKVMVTPMQPRSSRKSSEFRACVCVCRCACGLR